MSEDRLAQIQERHQQFEMLSCTAVGHERYLACKHCREPWPCDAVVMTEEGERLRTEVEEHDWLIGWQRLAMLPADRLWQEAHGTNAYPGLAELIAWLLAERERLDAGRAQKERDQLLKLIAWREGVLWRYDVLEIRQAMGLGRDECLSGAWDRAVARGQALIKGEAKGASK